MAVPAKKSATVVGWTYPHANETPQQKERRIKLLILQIRGALHQKWEQGNLQITQVAERSGRSLQTVENMVYMDRHYEPRLMTVLLIAEAAGLEMAFVDRRSRQLITLRGADKHLPRAERSNRRRTKSLKRPRKRKAKR